MWASSLRLYKDLHLKFTYIDIFRIAYEKTKQSNQKIICYSVQSFQIKEELRVQHYNLSLNSILELAQPAVLNYNLKKEFFV